MPIPMAMAIGGAGQGWMAERATTRALPASALPYIVIVGYCNVWNCVVWHDCK